MEFFRDLLPLVQKYMEQRDRIDRVVENSRPIVEKAKPAIEEFKKVQGVLLPDLRELARVFFPGVLEAPPRQAKRPARKRKR